MEIFPLRLLGNSKVYNFNCIIYYWVMLLKATFNLGSVLQAERLCQLLSCFRRRPKRTRRGDPEAEEGAEEEEEEEKSYSGLTLSWFSLT
jgi:hypothetical protein